MKLFQAVTIDPPGARDLDDAIRVSYGQEGWTLEVAVPDLTDLDLDAEGRRNGFTRYRSEGRTNPMLGDSVVDVRTLAPGDERPVILVTIPVMANGFVRDPKVERAIFRSQARLTYQEATEAINTPSSEHHKGLWIALGMARALFRHRRQSGAIAHYDLEKGVATNEDGALVTISVGGAPAEMIVREAMIATNAALAKFSAQVGLPLIYRNHRAKPIADRATLIEDLSLAAAGVAPMATVVERLAMVMDRADLSPKVKGHWSLNLPAYAWMTSPLRRYADLVNQKLLMAYLDQRPSPYAVAELEAIASDLNAAYEEARVSTSEAHKNRSETAALGRVRREAIDGLDGVDFTAVVKATTERGDIPEHVAAEFLKRLEAGSLTSKDIARGVLADRSLARVALEMLISAPHVAAGVLNYGLQSLGWSGYERSVERRGSDHAPLFLCRAQIEAANGKVTAEVIAKTSKDAQNAAALALIAEIAGVPEAAAALRSTEVPKGKPPVRATPVAHCGRPEANPRNALQELCQGERWRMPSYETKTTGPSHLPTFTTTCRLQTPDGDQVATGDSSRSKKDAEKSAAAAMLAQIEAAPAPAGP